MILSQVILHFSHERETRLMGFIDIWMRQLTGVDSIMVMKQAVASPF